MSTPTFALYDRILGGTLAERLRSWRDDEQLTFFEITQRLRDDDISVTPETVRKWLIEVGGHIPTARPRDGAA